MLNSEGGIHLNTMEGGVLWIAQQINIMHRSPPITVATPFLYKFGKLWKQSKGACFCLKRLLFRLWKMRFQISNDIQHNIGGGRNLDFRGNEDIEEVIMKLSASGANIRRSPVRDTNPREQKSDKHAGHCQRGSASTQFLWKHRFLDDSKNKSSKESGPAKLKDGNKTHIPKGFQPIVMPGTGP